MAHSDPDKLRPRMRRRPEVLAPAGDRASLHVALQNGADAVYFGLDEGFNARLRAENFSLDNLAEVVATIHRAGARAYLTLNTLVFESELAAVERLIRGAARAGVDALIVADPAVALLAGKVCPALELHASTQMTISSAEAATFAATLGVSRVVVPRELSVSEIRRLAESTDLELEVFISGALCVSWSGQCLSSEAWGGRSANRGQCAQACRLPYDLVVDDETRPLGDVTYLLSPKDLAGFRAVGDLMEIGVHTLKIEGRQKSPAYVHAATGGMRRWVDALARGATPSDVAAMRDDVRSLSLAYSRGLSDGWLAGSDHQTLVEGRFPRHRGICLGRVASIDGQKVRVAPIETKDDACGTVSSPLPALGGSSVAGSGPAMSALEPRAGQGVVFDAGHPERDEEGGPIFSARRQGRQWVLGFGRPGPDLSKVAVGNLVWVTSDAAQQTQVQRALKAPPPSGRTALRAAVSGQAGESLRVSIRGGRVREAVVAVSDTPLTAARGAGLDDATLRDKLCAFGGTPYRLEELDSTDLASGLFLPVSELKRLRRTLVEALDDALAATERRDIVMASQFERLRAEARQRVTDEKVAAKATPHLVVLCRTDEQLEAAIACGCDEVILDWMEMVGLGKACVRAREAGLRVGIATVRVQKPGEESYDRRIERLVPDAVLVRHWAGVMHFSSRRDASVEKCPSVHGDFSLNVTNSITASHLLGLRLDTVTAAHDLDEAQLMALLDHVPPHRVEVIAHHHIPTFHTEHCVYSNTLSHGRDFRTCGRPCESHRIALRDRVGLEHPVLVDVGCRNTVFNAAAQSAASLAPRLCERGVRRLRIEFVRESREEATVVLQGWQALLAGRVSPAELIRRIGVHEQFGVTPGTMQTIR